MNKSEILVHISAPSGAVDDARYRAQVKAILNFQAHSRETITLRTGEPEHHEANPNTSPGPRLLQPTGTIDQPPPVPALPVPSHRVPKRHASQKDSLESPVSCIPDSQPSVQPVLAAENLSLLPEINHYSPTIPSKRPRVRSPPPLDLSRERDEVRHDGTEDSKAISTHVTASPITANDPSGKEEKQTHTAPPEEKPSPSASAFFSLSLPIEIKPPPPPISQSPFTTHITPTLEMLTKRLKSNRTYNPTTQTRALDPLERGYWYLRFTLVSRASGPEPGSETGPKTKPSSPTSWDIALFTKFRTFLTNFISKEGRAGWGVWCIFEDETQIQNPQEAAADRGIGTGTGINTDKSVSTEHPESKELQSQPLSLKVYAWGEIACHIYLLLFLASDRRVRTMGAQWRDARDAVVIQMP